MPCCWRSWRPAFSRTPPCRYGTPVSPTPTAHFAAGAAHSQLPGDAAAVRAGAGVVLHWEAVLNPAWISVRLQPLPGAWTWGVTLALFPGLLFIVEELLRCLRAAQRG